MSFRKRLSAFSRCLIPFSTKSHSSAVMILGMMSKGNIFSTPSPLEYTVKVMQKVENPLVGRPYFLAMIHFIKCTLTDIVSLENVGVLHEA